MNVKFSDIVRVRVTFPADILQSGAREVEMELPMRSDMRILSQEYGEHIQRLLGPAEAEEFANEMEYQVQMRLLHRLIRIK